MPDKLIKHVGPLTYRDQTIHLNGHHYIDCTFERCSFEVDVGTSWRMTRCAVDQPSFFMDFPIINKKHVETIRKLLDVFEPAIEARYDELTYIEEIRFSWYDPPE